MIELKGRVAYGRPVVTRRQIALAATADSVAGVRRDISPRRIKLSSTAHSALSIECAGTFTSPPPPPLPLPPEIPRGDPPLSPGHAFARAFALAVLRPISGRLSRSSAVNGPRSRAQRKRHTLHARRTERERERERETASLLWTYYPRRDEIWRKFNNGHPVCRITEVAG